RGIITEPQWPEALGCSAITPGFPTPAKGPGAPGASDKQALSAQSHSSPHVGDVGVRDRPHAHRLRPPSSLIFLLLRSRPQFRRDVLKAIPVGLLAIPPFANFLVIVLMYFFPRQLLIRYFWTPSQQREFLAAYHAIRSAAYPEVLQSLALAASSLPEPRLQTQLQELCTKVQRGAQPRVAELYALRSLFSGPPLGLSKLHASHVRALSRVLFLTPRLPAFVLRHRLHGHVLEIRHLDRALLRLGLGQLSEEELRAVRKAAPPSRGGAERAGSRWVSASLSRAVSEVSLLANSMVLLSLNYLRAKE
uniref:LETM1 domain containing 1 n=1 Tax=Anas zonorhyncha TaxID=75864 RepID=A0A8B9VW94_9AVES